MNPMNETSIEEKRLQHLKQELLHFPLQYHPDGSLPMACLRTQSLRLSR